MRQLVHVREGVRPVAQPAGRPVGRVVSPVPGAWVLSLQRDAGNRAVGGLLTTSRSDASHSATVLMPFPHRRVIEAAARPLPGAAVLDPAGCRRRGVPAFTDGLTTHFASRTPSLVVAAHESAHQLQHAGRTRDLGLGPEGHAQAVSTTIGTGSSARGLLGSEGSPVPVGSRNYTEISEAEQAATGHWHVGGLATVGDEGRTVTTDADTHALYADPALIVESNAVLRAKQSGVRLETAGPGPSGPAPDGSGARSTVKARYTILSDVDGEEFYADCGYSAREVQGPSGTDTSPRGIYLDAAGNRAETSRSKNPADFRDEIFVEAGLGPDRASAHAAYNALSAAEQDRFDQKHGINRYAAPGAGEAFTRRRDDELGGRGFNFHWGGVVMVAGGDRVTFENYTKGEGYTAKDTAWYFATYGPPSKPGQTWHERWQSVGGAGKGTTMAAATSADPAPFVRAAASLSTADAIAAHRASVVEGERMALESEVRSRSLKVTVVVRSAQESEDEVYVVCSHGGRRATTGAMEMDSGDRNTFWISLDKLFPVDGKIVVKVLDSDVFSDDLISVLDFDVPYAPVSDNRPWDGAEYHTTVELDR